MKVELIAYTPNPDDLCGVASRTCISKKIPAKCIENEEEGLSNEMSVHQALKSGHESVAEHACFTFKIEGVSRALSHQLVRHRMASYSQQSQRYVKMDGFEYVIPESIEKSKKLIWCCNPLGYDNVLASYTILMHEISNVYNKMVDAGIPEEDARYILPNACTTNLVVTMNARELRHFFKLRCCERAQWEIRELANMMLAQCKEVAPVLFDKAGASCVATGKCPEGKRSCGKVKA